MVEKSRLRWVRQVGVALAIVGALLTAACAGNSSSSEPEPQDDAFLNALVSGWTARWDFFADPEQELAIDDPKYAEKYKEQLNTAVHLELDKLSPYPTLPFEDAELRSRATEYVGLLEESLDALQYLNVENARYETLWFDVYDRRTIAILDFVDTYSLEIPDEHQSTVKEMRTNADSAKSRASIETALSSIICELDWQIVEENFGHFIYEAVAVNSGETDFASINLDVSIIDTDGVNRGTSYAHVKNWRVGQSAVFELFTESLLASFDATTYWETPDGQRGDITSSCAP